MVELRRRRFSQLRLTVEDNSYGEASKKSEVRRLFLLALLELKLIVIDGPQTSSCGGRLLSEVTYFIAPRMGLVGICGYG